MYIINICIYNKYLTRADGSSHLLPHGAGVGHGAAVVGSRAGVALGHLLPVLPPLTPIANLQLEKKGKTLLYSRACTYQYQIHRISTNMKTLMKVG